MSAQALGRLASALRMTPPERRYLFTLSGRGDPEAPSEAALTEPPPELTAAIGAMTAPAYGLDPYWNRCGWNADAARLFSVWLEGAEPNLLRYIFLDADAKTLILDWEDRARRVLAELRADYSRRLDDPRMRRLVEGLKEASPDFARWWEEQAVLAREGGIRRFSHPEDGRVAFAQHTFSPAARPDYKLVILIPNKGAA